MKNQLTYGDISDLETIRGQDNRLLIGVTGGIASGKTTVADMLQELGAHVIDFDILAREVVEPEEPAWKDIVAYFGEQLLNEDRSLNRKKLSGIVFMDMEKRKKLEGFTHSRINEKFKQKLDAITKDDPEAIILAVIPLLIEGNLQYLYHKIIVVHVPREVQIKRLTVRDNITKDEAARILDAQLPIDEKTEYADFIIHNEKSLEDTRLQVKKLWKELKILQNDREKSTA